MSLAYRILFFVERGRAEVADFEDCVNSKDIPEAACTAPESAISQVIAMCNTFLYAISHLH